MPEFPNPLPDSQLVRQTIRTMARQGDTSHLDWLLERARNDPDESVRRLALQAIEHLRPLPASFPNDEPLFLRQLDLSHPVQRMGGVLLLDLTIFVMVNVLVSVGMLLLGAPFVRLALANSLTLEANSREMRIAQAAIRAFSTMSALELIVTGLLVGLISILLALVTNYLIHSIMLRIIGGYERFSTFLSNTLVQQAMITLLGGGALLLSLLLLQSGHPAALLVACLWLMGIGLGLAGWYARLIGSAYGVGSMRGIQAIVWVVLFYGTTNLMIVGLFSLI